MTTSSACSSRSAQPTTISRPASPGSRNRLSRQAEPAVRLRAASKVYGDVRAVDGIDLDVGQGEFFTMLGPSGSGKTTTLRMIAGFELPSSGTVELEGREVSRLAPYERDVNTVFQDYALFPHMRVGDNVAYGLMVRKVPKSSRRERVAEAVRMVRPAGYEKRQPQRLPGGKRPRVAPAPTPVNRAKLLPRDAPVG